jgi:hypothetical protein
MQISKTRGDVARSSPEPQRAFERAIQITPFDPGAYALRGVSALAVDQSIGKSLLDLEKALDTDPENGDARNALARIQSLAQNSDAPLPASLRTDLQGSGGAALRTRIDELARRYRVAPK